MRRRVRGLKGIKAVTKPDGRRYLYRRVGSILVPLPDLTEHHPDFIAAYVKAGEVKEPTRYKDGSISALCLAYLASPEHKRMAPSTRNVWRRTLDRISKERGVGLVSDLRPEHLRKDIRALTPGAAQNRLKAWRSILKFAVEEGWISADPSQSVKAQKGETVPHRQWTRDEIDGYRKHWACGTPERIAFEVIYWTGARCVDAVRLGWQMVDQDGWLSFVQAKTKGPATCPVRDLPEWASAISNDHRQFVAALPADQMLWITSSRGKGRSVKALSQWISASATKAGLPDDCTAHGLRKARAAALAEAGATASQIGAWTGHVSLQEVAHYTRQADQKGILGGKRERSFGNRKEQFPK